MSNGWDFPHQGEPTDDGGQGHMGDERKTQPRPPLTPGQLRPIDGGQGNAGSEEEAGGPANDNFGNIAKIGITAVVGIAAVFGLSRILKPKVACEAYSLAGVAMTGLGGLGALGLGALGISALQHHDPHGSVTPSWTPTALFSFSQQRA